MGFDFFTMQGLARELGERLAGRRIVRAGSAHNRLGLACGQEGYVLAQAGREGFFCFVEASWPQELRHRKGAEQYLVNARITAVEAERRERLIRLRLERTDRAGQVSHGQLVCELVPGRCQCVLFSERTGEVLGHWAGQGGRPGQGVVIGQPYRPPPPLHRLVPGEDSWDAFAQALEAEQGPPEQIAHRLLGGLDLNAARELVHRVGLDEGAPGKEAWRRLWEVAAQLYGTPLPEGAWVWKQGEATCFSALCPTHLGTGYTRRCSISQAIWHSWEEKERSAQERQQRQQLSGQLKKALKSVQGKMEAVRRDLEEAQQAEELERKGNILLAQLDAVPARASQVELPDVYDPSGQARVRLELDPGQTPAENAARFLRQARKYRRRLQVLPDRLKGLESTARELENHLHGLAAGLDLARADLRIWIEEKGLVHPQKPRARGPKERQVHPRRYRTSTGWVVWAGRNDRENDALTHGLAAQNDIWLHAHGYAGSHVVLRREGRREEPDSQTLVEAAGVAAYWSKGKTARKVPVVYTLVKYVSRPRGATAGQAVVRREKTIMATPALLPEEDKGEGAKA
jgi:predicted ribosome quality control (RQC) complex YloA/Tae2 family protein